MPTLKYFIKGEQENSTIYIRFANGRKFDYKKSTPYKVLPKHWNTEKGHIRNIADAHNKDEINNKLLDLQSHIFDTYLADYDKGVKITSVWLQNTINDFYNQNNDSDLNRVVEYGKRFIKYLPNKINESKGGKLGVSNSTIQKYTTVVKKIEGFEKHIKSKLYFSDINPTFQKKFIEYLRNVENLGENTIGRTIKFVKTICNEAVSDGIDVNPEMNKLKGFTTKARFVYLNEEEIKKIIKFDFNNTPYLDNARDWLVIGLYTGQRVSDFMNFDKTTVKGEFLEFTQEKTGAYTIVPIHDHLKTILSKNDGNFPRKISDQRFNDYIKTVCEKVGLTYLVEGAMINSETNRKESGIYPKYKLVTSHICRRSFATNHYGKLPTPIIMSITNHSTEKMFLTYIGKTQKDHAEQLKEYWIQQKSDSNNVIDSPLKELKS